MIFPGGVKSATNHTTPNHQSHYRTIGKSQPAHWASIWINKICALIHLSIEAKKKISEHLRRPSLAIVSISPKIISVLRLYNIVKLKNIVCNYFVTYLFEQLPLNNPNSQKDVNGQVARVVNPRNDFLKLLKIRQDGATLLTLRINENNNLD